MSIEVAPTTGHPSNRPGRCTRCDKPIVFYLGGDHQVEDGLHIRVLGGYGMLVDLVDMDFGPLTALNPEEKEDTSYLGDLDFCTLCSLEFISMMPKWWINDFLGCDPKDHPAIQP